MNFRNMCSIKNCVIGIVIIALWLLGFWVITHTARTIHKDAQVLSINENVLDGRMIGQFLGSASGYITDGAVLVGIRVDFGDRMFLTDAKLNNAELVFYKDKSTLPMMWTINFFNGKLVGRLNGRPVVSINTSSKLSSKLLKVFKEFQG